MTQTPGPSSTAEPSTVAGPPPPGFDRSRARDLDGLRRSTSDRKVAGVAGGLGRHLDIDPTIIRVVLVVLCFFGGAGFLLYGVAWLLVPEDGHQVGKLSMRPSTRNALLIGALVLAALLVLGDSWGGVGFPWPVAVVGLGVLGYLALRDRDPAVRSASTAQPPAAYADGPPPWQPPAPAPAPPPSRRPKHGPLLFGFTLALLAVALGSLGLYDTSGGQVVGSAYPALALAVVGLMLVLGSVVGRAGGLIALGIVAAVALAVTSLVGAADGFTSADGERLAAAPVNAAAVKDAYTIETGQVRLDLSKVSDPQELAGRTIEVSARAGELVVVLPRGVAARVDADLSGPGQIDLPGRSSGGFGNDLSETYGSGPGTLTVDARLFAGHIDVRRP